MTLPSWPRWGFGFAVAVGVSVLPFAGGCSQQEAPAVESARPVKTTIVMAGEPLLQRTFPGRVGASMQVELAFQVPGLIVNLPVREGQRVARGEVVAELRRDEFEARLGSIQGQLEQARAALVAARAGQRPEEILRLETQVRSTAAVMARARLEYDRVIRMRDNNVASAIELEQAQMTYRVAVEDHQAAIQGLEIGQSGRQEDVDAAEATVRGLEARVVEAQLQLNDTVLRAPYDGVIAQRFVEQQQNVQAKQRVVRFQDVNEIEVVVDVPETTMAQIRLADIERLVADFSSAPGVSFPVRVTEFAQAADPVTQTFRVRTAMQSPEGVALLPGMTGSVTMTYRRADILENRIHVPITAVFHESAGESIVWVLDAGQQARRRPVRLGSPSGDQIEILEGLAPGEQIAVAGVRFLRDGMAVRDLGSSLGGIQQ
jgi:RND family efflux transporter MFP subunit